MKIRYKKITRPTDIDLNIIMKSILIKLDEQGYTVTNQTQNYIEFIYNKWSFGLNIDVLGKIDGGKFEADFKNKTIALSFFLSPIFEIIASCITAIFGIIKHCNIFSCIIFIMIIFIFRITYIKIAANLMMRNLLNI
ncbi:MAG: hypothetical protein JWR09_3214 [Mucilaginibacter sp.]|nr:hypothetical protein [Mucilaginibacter sp.]